MEPSVIELAADPLLPDKLQTANDDVSMRLSDFRLTAEERSALGGRLEELETADVRVRLTLINLDAIKVVKEAEGKRQSEPEIIAALRKDPLIPLRLKAAIVQVKQAIENARTPAVERKELTERLENLISVHEEQLRAKSRCPSGAMRKLTKAVASRPSGTATSRPR